MEIIESSLDFQLNIDTAVAMGKFDGLHIGHRELLSHVLAQKDRGLSLVCSHFLRLPQCFSAFPMAGN